MTPTPQTPLSPTRLRRSVAALEHLVPAWFALVMGWCGLSQAWLNASDLLGEMAFVLGQLGAVFALAIFVLLCVSSVVRLSVHPQAVAADMRHPVRHAFMATLPISILLLATLGVQLLGRASSSFGLALAVAWCTGSFLELLATVWVIRRWLGDATQKGIQWATFTPVFFIPVVGNVLAPLGGVPLGFDTWSVAQMGIGFLLWPVLLALLFVRVSKAGPLPPRLSASWFITLVPPSIIGMCLLQLDAPMPLVWVMWGMAVFFFGLVLTQVRRVHEQPFGLAHWSMSFPMAAFTSFTLRMAQEPGGSWLTLPSLVLLALTSLLILGLTFNTWHGLRRGLLLVAEK